MRNARIILLICAILLSGCGEAAAGRPVSTPTASTGASEVSGAPHGLEVISSQNITQVMQIAKWGDGKIYDVAVSPDKQTIAVITVKGVYLYSSTTLEEKQFIKLEIINTESFINWEISDTKNLSLQVSFSPDGKYLAISCGRFVSLLNLSTNEYDYFLVSQILATTTLDVQISHDNKHIILYTHGSYLGEPTENYALYDISKEDSLLIYDRYLHDYQTYSVARFTKDNKAYFFYWYRTSPLPYAMDVVDLSTHTVIERVSYEKINHDPMRTFYDISPDGKIIAALGFKDNETTTRLIDIATGKVIQRVAEEISFEPTTQDGEVAWRYKWQRSNLLKNKNCKIVPDDYTIAFQEVISDGNNSTFVISTISGLITGHFNK